jgi:hypothetical protein
MFIILFIYIVLDIYDWCKAPLNILMKRALYKCGIYYYYYYYLKRLPQKNKMIYFILMPICMYSWYYLTTLPIFMHSQCDLIGTRPYRTGGLTFPTKSGSYRSMNEYLYDWVQIPIPRHDLPGLLKYESQNKIVLNCLDTRHRNILCQKIKFYC